MTLRALTDILAARFNRPPVMVPLAGPPKSASLMSAPDAVPGYLGLVPDSAPHRNEVAALAFLDRRLGFLNIAAVVADTLSRVTATGVDSCSDSACDAALAVDAQARRAAESIVQGLAAAA